MRLVDTHCHLYMDAFPDPEPVVEEARAAGVDRMIVVGIDQATCVQAIQLAERFEGVYAIIGHHPNNAAKFTPDDLKWIEDLLAHPKAVALGEIGLDYHWDHATKEQQFASLGAQLDLGVRLGKPIVFHCREAYSDLLDFLQAAPKHPHLIHCFGGTLPDARRAVELGIWFGVDGPVTYKKSIELREIVAELPGDRIVLETDSPYLSPEPFRGKTNSPARIPYINRMVAACRGISEEACAELTTQNAQCFFGLI